MRSEGMLYLFHLELHDPSSSTCNITKEKSQKTICHLPFEIKKRQILPFLLSNSSDSFLAVNGALDDRILYWRNRIEDRT
jgi:hypothetical protein